MPDDPMESLSAHCGTCSGIFEVTWCPAWDAWLCLGCRAIRADSELRMPLALKGALQAAAGTEPG